MWEEDLCIDKTTNVEMRAKEHFGNIKNGEEQKSLIAVHVWTEEHTIGHKPILWKHSSNKQELSN